MHTDRRVRAGKSGEHRWHDNGRGGLRRGSNPRSAHQRGGGDGGGGGR